jgi:hypothetical protein
MGDRRFAILEGALMKDQDGLCMSRSKRELTLSNQRIRAVSSVSPKERQMSN